MFRTVIGCPKCRMHSYMKSIETQGVCPFCLVKLVKGYVDDETNRFITPDEFDELNGDGVRDLLKERMKHMDTLNDKTVTLRITRSEVIDLMVACLLCSSELEADFQRHDKWDLLHDKLEHQLLDFDKKHM